MLNNTIQSGNDERKTRGRDCAFIETNLATCLDWLRSELNARNCFVIQMIAALPACLVDCTRRHSLCVHGALRRQTCVHCLRYAPPPFMAAKSFKLHCRRTPFSDNYVIILIMVWITMNSAVVHNNYLHQSS